MARPSALSHPNDYMQAYPNCDMLNGDINPFTNLLRGGLITSGLRLEYTSDAKSRLVRVTPLAPTAGSI
jgi:hypothetical protein